MGRWFLTKTNHHVLSHGTRGSHASRITRSLSYLTLPRDLSCYPFYLWTPAPQPTSLPKDRFCGTRLCSTNRLGHSVTLGTKHRVPIRDGTRRQARHHQRGVISSPRTTRADWHNTGRLCRPDDFDDKRAAVRPHQTDMYRHLYIVPTSPAQTFDHGEQSPTPAAAAGEGPFCSIDAVLLVAMSERAAERMMPLRRRRATPATSPLSPAPLTGLAVPQALSH
jgi:hypothetical protein